MRIHKTKYIKLILTLFYFSVCSPCFSQPDTLIDTRDGNVYSTIKIGDQTWMAENLRFIDTLYLAEKNHAIYLNLWFKDRKKGEEYLGLQVKSLNRFALCYNDSLANLSKYGALYIWESANKACPNGWHLPSKADYQQLFNSQGGNKHENYRSLIVGGPSGLNFKLAGFISHFDTWGEFSLLNKRGIYWTSSDVTKKQRKFKVVIFSKGNQRVAFFDRYYNTWDAHSVRCVKD
jgi:uncharacterized protein (TIGR02145 family)